MKLKLPGNFWYGEPIEIEFPSSWKVDVLRMLGDGSQSIGKDEIISAIRNPIGSKKLSELAKGKDGAVIIFDDMTRPTRAGEIAEAILEEIGLEEVVFVCANGAHGTFTREDFAKKLGERIVESYPVFNHNPYENLEYLGETSFGTPLEINSEVMSYPLKIAIGCILPHPQYGFGGGAKIILPGVAGMRSIIYNHGVLGGWSYAMNFRELHESCQAAYGRHLTIQQKDAEEAAKLAGLDFLVNVLVNTEGKHTHAFAGGIEAYHTGVEVAKRHYSTAVSFDYDVVIANAAAKASEAKMAIWTTICLKEGGTLVIVANTRAGQVAHFLHGRWGMRRRGGTLYLPPNSMLKKAGKIIFLSKYHERQPQFEIFENAVRVKSWDEVLEEIEGGEKKVAVFPDATVQKPF